MAPCPAPYQWRAGRAAGSSRTGHLCWGRGSGRAPSAFVTKTARPQREEGRRNRTSCLRLLLELRGQGLPSPPLLAAGWQSVLSLHLGQSGGDTPQCGPWPRVSASGCSAVTVVRVPSRPISRSRPCDCPSFVVSDVCNQTQRVIKQTPLPVSAPHSSCHLPRLASSVQGSASPHPPFSLQPNLGVCLGWSWTL